MRKQTALAALVLISLLSGCFPTGELSSALDEPFSKNSDVDFKPVLNVTFDLSYPENVTDRMQVYSGSFITWDINEVGGYFIPGFESLTDDGIQEYTEREIAAGELYRYRLKDGQSLSVSPGMLAYERNFNDPRNFGINYTYYCGAGESEEEMSKQYSFAEYPELSSKEAVEYTQNVISDLGLENLALPKIYSVESSIDPFLEDADPDLYAQFSDEDLNKLTGNHAYYILYTVKLSGYNTPVAETYFNSSDMAGVYGFAEFIIDKDGLQRLLIRGAMVCVPTGEYEDICTADEAVEKMKSTIGLVNETIPTVISGPELLYIGDYDDNSNTSRFIPAWRFAKKQDTGGKFLKYDFYYYDAQTGAMIQ